VLSKIMVTTWLTFPHGELSWQLPAAVSAGVATASFAAASVAVEAVAPAGAAHAGATGERRGLRRFPRQEPCGANWIQHLPLNLLFFRLQNWDGSSFQSPDM
jgi:hypothetical protein